MKLLRGYRAAPANSRADCVPRAGRNAIQCGPRPPGRQENRSAAVRCKPRSAHSRRHRRNRNRRSLPMPAQRRYPRTPVSKLFSTSGTPPRNRRKKCHFNKIFPGEAVVKSRAVVFRNLIHGKFRNFPEPGFHTVENGLSRYFFRKKLAFSEKSCIVKPYVTLKSKLKV